MFTNELYKAAEEIWEGYKVHPFVDELGSGKLDIEKFKFYMIQDYIYLIDYAKIFSIGAVKTLNQENMEVFSRLAGGIFNRELSIHKGYLKKLGITEEEIKNAKPSIKNLSYTHYMLAVSQNGDELDVAVAVLSCMWSYFYIAKALHEKYGLQDNFYKEWMEGYISKSYEELSDWCIDLVNKLAEGITPKRKERLTEIFYNCSRFEYMFWDMSYNMEM